MENYRHFYERVGERYPEEEAVYGTLSGQIRREFVIRRMHGWKGRFLDMGCNRGMYLKAYPGAPKVGIDLSVSVLKRLKQEEPLLNVVAADAQQLYCFKPGSFDAVLCSEVLEHVPSPKALFDGLRFVLAEGGTALITTPNYRGSKKPGWVDRGVLRRYGVDGVNGERYYHTAFKPEELEALALRAGLAVVESGTLEREIRYAAKVPALGYVALRAMNARLLKNNRIDEWNERAYAACTRAVHILAKALGLDPFFRRLVRDGVRSYLVVRNP